MKQNITIIFTILTLYSYGQQPQQINYDSLMNAKQTEAIGKPFPLFNASFQNHLFSNQNLKGKIVFINFWFAECAPCIAEMDALNELFEKLKLNKDVEFISFTYETPATIKKLKTKYKIKYKVFSLTLQDCYRLNQNNGFPTSIILDKTGTIRFLKNGNVIDKALARKIVFNEYYPRLLSELK